ncbi:MAG: GNAT family N-acetyltransferase, partial [Alphaproteobacteria bacterium]
MTGHGARAEPLADPPGLAATPELASSRLVLEPFTPSHLTDTYVGWLNDPLVMRYSENRHRTHTLASCREYFAAMRNGSHFFWAIHLASGPNTKGAHIGNITAYTDRRNSVADLAIVIGDRTVWGTGLGRESWALALDWLLDTG